MIRIAYQLLSKTVIWIAPFIFILGSMVFALPDGDLHKRTLSNSDFYSRLSEELRASEIEVSNGQIGFGTILYGTILKDIATSGWLKNFAEQNIDNFTQWLDGDVDEWVLYIPIQDVQLSASRQIDQEIVALQEEYGDQLQTCSAGQAETLRVERFSLNNEFCIPESVQNGEQTLTEFLQISDQDVETGEFLDNLVRNNPLSSTGESFRLDDFEYYTLPREQFFDQINILRDGFLLLQGVYVYVLLGLIALFATLLIVAKIAGRSVGTELRRFLFYTSLGIFTLSAIVILFLGGTVYFTSIIQNFLLPGFATNAIVTMISFEAVKFGFNLVSYAFWIGVVMITVNFFLQYADNTGLFSDTADKNKSIEKFQQNQSSNPGGVNTFDSQFRDSLKPAQAPASTQPSPDSSTAQFSQSSAFSQQTPFGKVDNHNPALDPTTFQAGQQSFDTTTKPVTGVTPTNGSVSFNTGVNDTNFQNGYQTPPSVPPASQTPDNSQNQPQPGGGGRMPGF
jgi:hypothetical protein